MAIPGLKIKTDEEEAEELMKASEEFCKEQFVAIAIDETRSNGIIDL